jgi:hypothetical protein
MTWGRLDDRKGDICMAYFLGFDAAKRKLDWALVNEQGIEQAHGIVVNDDAVIAELLLAVVTILVRRLFV